MKDLLFICGLAVCFASCEDGNPSSEILTIDAEKAIYTPRVFDLSEIAKEIDFVILDDTDQESLISNISRIRESRERFYISDGYRHPIKIFDKTGDFLYSIGTIGQGPNELPGINVFAVDYKNENVYILGGRRIIAYNSMGNISAQKDSVMKVSSMEIMDNAPVIMKYSEGKSHLDGKMDLLEIFSPALERKKIINVLDKGSTIVSKLSNGQIEVRYLNDGVILDNGTRLVVKEVLNDTVFHYSADKGMEPAYRLDLGESTIPQGATGPKPSKPWSDRFYSFSTICEGERYIIARANNFIEESCLIFDKRNPSEGFSAVGPDGIPGFFIDGVTFTPCYVHDNRLVGYMQTIDIVDNASLITNPDLASVAATLKEESNPVIVVATLKK